MAFLQRTPKYAYVLQLQLKTGSFIGSFYVETWLSRKHYLMILSIQKSYVLQIVLGLQTNACTKAPATLP